MTFLVANTPEVRAWLRHIERWAKAPSNTAAGPPTIRPGSVEHPPPGNRSGLRTTGGTHER